VPNAALAGAALDRHACLDTAGQRFLEAAATRLGWSPRSHHRVLRVARTIADLAAGEAVTLAHLAEAIQFRRTLSPG
jgi:magnesium chelatase family protein